MHQFSNLSLNIFYVEPRACGCGITYNRDMQLVFYRFRCQQHSLHFHRTVNIFWKFFILPAGLMSNFLHVSDIFSEISFYSYSTHIYSIIRTRKNLKLIQLSSVYVFGTLYQYYYVYFPGGNTCFEPRLRMLCVLVLYSHTHIIAIHAKFARIPRMSTYGYKIWFSIRLNLLTQAYESR